MDYTCALFGMPMLWVGFILIGLLMFFFPKNKDKKETTLDILDRKFAEGALSVAEYEERKAILQRSPKG